jgi:signal transduction histidine kinase
MYPDASFRVDGGLPPPDLAVEANEMLSSVVGNVLTNAVQHNDTDAPTVEVGVETTPTTVTIRVADDGPGFPAGPEAAFEPGEPVLDSDGTGLGLYLVRELVSRYGGDVGAEENAPRGSVVAVELDRA